MADPTLPSYANTAQGFQQVKDWLAGNSGYQALNNGQDVWTAKNGQISFNGNAVQDISGSSPIDTSKWDSTIDSTAATLNNANTAAKAAPSFTPPANGQYSIPVTRADGSMVMTNAQGQPDPASLPVNPTVTPGTTPNTDNSLPTGAVKNANGIGVDYTGANQLLGSTTSVNSGGNTFYPTAPNPFASTPTPITSVSNPTSSQSPAANQYPAPGQTVGDLFTNASTGQTFNWRTGALVNDPKNPQASTSGGGPAAASGTPTPPANPFSQTLTVGSSGSDVSNLQKILNAQGATLTVDGKYGAQTAAAVKAYQQENGLTADGIFGPQTSAALTGQINAVGDPSNQPSSTIPTPAGVVNPNAPVNIGTASSPTFDSSAIGTNSTADVLSGNQNQANQINQYLQQQSDAYAALNNTKATALQGQADIMYGKNGSGGADASLQGTEQAQFDRQMAFQTVPAQVAYDSAQMSLSLYKQTPAYLTETQARDTAFNMLQTYPDINYAYDPNQSAQQNLQNIKEALPSSAKYQATLVSYKGYMDPNGLFHLYNSKNISGSPVQGGAGAGIVTSPAGGTQNTQTTTSPGPFTPAPSPSNPVTPVGTYLGVGATNLTDPAPLVDKATTKPQVDFVNDWNSGTLGTARNALGTALGHLFDADSLFKNLSNTTVQPINAVKNWFGTAFGADAPSNYNTAQSLASDELASAYGANSAGDREQLSQFGGTNQSPSQHAGYITTATNLLASKLSAMAQQYSGAFGHMPASLDTLISPMNQLKLFALSGANLATLVPGVHVSPSTQALVNSAQKNPKTGVVRIPSGTNGGWQIIN